MYWHQDATTSLHEERLEAVVDAVLASAARSVLDLGCGDGDVLVRLAQEPTLERLMGLDRDARCLERVRSRLESDPRAASAPTQAGGTARRRPSIELLQGSLTQPEAALTGFDCILLVETIEHIDPRELAQAERAIFGQLRPDTVIITTPNAELNPLLDVPPNRFRHPDHRFEWDRARFQRWAGGVAQRQGYGVRHRDIGSIHPVYGGASQMALFQRHNR